MAKQYSEKVKRDPSYYKPKNYKHYLTTKEVAVFIGRDPRRIREAEKLGKIDRPATVKRGCLEIRLYSPKQVEEIKQFFKTQRRGRPSGKSK